MIQLYTRNISNYCFKTEWMLLELGVAYERHLNKGDDDAEGLGKVAKVSPVLITVPTLVDEDGFVLTESSAIIQYIVDSRKMKTPLFPTDVKERARILQWDRFGDFQVAKALGTFYYNSVDYLKGAAANAMEIEDARKELPILEEKLEAILSKQKYITSDIAFTYADISVAVHVFFLSWFNFKVTKPGVARWLEECTVRPSFKKRMAMIG